MLPTKENFLEDKVSEPLAVKLAGLYDVWDHRDPRAVAFQSGLRSVELTKDSWDALLDSNELGFVSQLVHRGQIIQEYAKRLDASIIQANGFDLRWEGLTFLALNSARCNSLAFEAGIQPHHDALLAFKWTAKGWLVSLYGLEDSVLDLSQIAVKYGGGGHRLACGFTCRTLPFALP
jgi:hypothetical protein